MFTIGFKCSNGNFKCSIGDVYHYCRCSVVIGTLSEAVVVFTVVLDVYHGV